MRYVMIFAMAMLLIAGVCGSSSAQTEDELLALEKAIHEAINAHDVDQLMSYFADDAVTDFVASGATPAHGKEEVAEFMEALLKAFPDIHFDTHRMLISGNILVSEYTMTGTHTGDWLGIPANGWRFSSFTRNNLPGSNL